MFDPTLPITDATGTIHAPVVSLYHAFGLFGRSANITGSLPFAIGDLSGKVRARIARPSATASPTPQVRFAVNLVGGPALSVAEFVKTPLPRTLLGASIKVVAPTGQYDPARLINIGTNRWGFKPEIGYTGRPGRFVIDAFAGVWFFTANDSFAVSDANPLGVTRTQEPIGAFEFHVSYDVKPRLWLSADINYWRGGRTSVNGVEGTQTLQANSRFGVTGSVPLTPPSIAQGQLQRRRHRPHRRQLQGAVGWLAVRLDWDAMEMRMPPAGRRSRPAVSRRVQIPGDRVRDRRRFAPVFRT